MSKGFLQGFSIGILLTTLLVSMTIYSLEDQSLENNEQTLTDEEVNGYLRDANQTIISKEEFERLTELETENQQLRTQLELATKQESNREESKETTDKETEQEIEYVFDIKQGMTVPEISEKLEELKIVENSSELSSYLSERGWQGSIQIGTFELSSSMTVEEVAKIITKNP